MNFELFGRVQILCSGMFCFCNLKLYHEKYNISIVCQIILFQEIYQFWAISVKLDTSQGSWAGSGSAASLKNKTQNISLEKFPLYRHKIMTVHWNLKLNIVFSKENRKRQKMERLRDVFVQFFPKVRLREIQRKYFPKFLATFRGIFWNDSSVDYQIDGNTFCVDERVGWGDANVWTELTEIYWDSPK